MGTHIWVVAALLAGAGATTPASEVATLRDFYGALGGDVWVDSDGFSPLSSNKTNSPARFPSSSAR